MDSVDGLLHSVSCVSFLGVIRIQAWKMKVLSGENAFIDVRQGVQKESQNPTPPTFYDKTYRYMKL